jgi:hypothetical protein
MAEIVVSIEASRLAREADKVMTRDRRHRLRNRCDCVGFLLLGVLLGLAFVSPQAGQFAQAIMSFSRAVAGS